MNARSMVLVLASRPTPILIEVEGQLIGTSYLGARDLILFGVACSWKSTGGPTING
jgi:hypothetical protein